MKIPVTVSTSILCTSHVDAERHRREGEMLSPSKSLTCKETHHVNKPIKTIWYNLCNQRIMCQILTSREGKVNAMVRVGRDWK